MSPEQREQFQTLSTTLLQRIGRAEDIIRAGAGGPTDGTLDFNDFGTLLTKIDLDCTPDETKALFDMIDSDGSGTIEVDELRERLRSSDAITRLYSESLRNVALTLVPALVLAGGFAIFKGPASGFDFLTGYVVEDSLSVDNLFVFLVLFKYFRVPPALQTFALNLGIYGAVVLRAVFIFAGLAAIKSFQPLLLLFSGFLIFSSYSALFAGDEEDDDDEEEAPPELVQSFLDNLPTSPDFDGDKLLVQSPSGQWLATPLLVCIIAVELSDLLFAVDSIPAVFAVTEDPAIVFTSNIAAILGLRSLYQVLSIAVQDLAYLEQAVAVVLGFVGVKLAAEVFGFGISSGLSLLFIILTLAGGVLLSLAEQGGDGKDDSKKRRKSTVEKVVSYISDIFKF